MRKPDLLALTIDIWVVHPRLELHLQKSPLNNAAIIHSDSLTHRRRFEREIMAEIHRQYEFAVCISCFRLTSNISKASHLNRDASALG